MSLRHLVSEFLHNDPPKSSRIAIRRNEIDAVFDVKGIYPFHYVIFINDNILKTDQVLIEDNSIRVKNLSIHRVRDMGVFVLTGTNYLVRQNRIELLENFDGQVFRFGSGGNLVLIDFGMSLTDSVIESNEIVGSYQGDGIFFSGGIRNKSRNNIFRLGSSFAGNSKGVTIKSKRTINVCGNVWEGDTGKIVGDISRSC